MELLQALKFRGRQRRGTPVRVAVPADEALPAPRATRVEDERLDRLDRDPVELHDSPRTLLVTG
jgi:hypothetical protein